MLAIVPFENQPTVLDISLAEHLGMARPRSIRRDVIQAHLDEFNEFGILQARPTNSGRRGRPGIEYFLNRHQALLACILSNTSKAREVRAEVIRRFDEYESPKLPSTYLDALKALIASEEEKLLLTERVKELDELTVKEFCSLKHLSVPFRSRAIIGMKASRLAKERGITLDKQEFQFVDRKTGRTSTSSANVYPASLLELALQDFQSTPPQRATVMEFLHERLPSSSIGTRAALGRLASRMAKKAGQDVTKQKRRYDHPEWGKRDVLVSSYPVTILEAAAKELNIQ